MNNRFQFLFTAMLGLVTAFTARADGLGPTDVILYLAPDASTPLLMHEVPGDPRLASAKPVADAAKAAAGWQTVEFTGTFTGYVQTSQTKDFTVIPGSPIYSASKEDSAVLAKAPEAPALVTKTSSGQWGEVSYTGPVTAYFQKAAPAMPEVKALEVKAPEVKVVPPPAPVVVAPTRPTAVTPISTVPAVTPVAAVPAATKVDATEVPRFYTGTLKLRTNPITSGPINAEYMLYADNGAFIALVDLGGVVLPNPIASYLGKRVKIFGAPYTMSSMPSVVIRAQMLQAN